MKKKQVIALGGGAFSDKPDNLAIENYILSQTSKAKPRVCFLPTASGDSEVNIERFHAVFEKLGAAASHVSLFRQARKPASHLLARPGRHLRRRRKYLEYVGPVERVGNYQRLTPRLLAGHNPCGKQCRGALLVQRRSHRFKPGRFFSAFVLGVVEGQFCPHFDSEPQRRPIFRSMIRLGKLAGGYAVDDGVALHFIDGALSSVVSSRPSAGADSFALAWRSPKRGSLSPVRLSALARRRHSRKMLLEVGQASPAHKPAHMASVKMIYYLDILSSWCTFVEPALAKVRSRFGSDLDYEWRISVLRNGKPLNYSNEDLSVVLCSLQIDERRAAQ